MSASLVPPSPVPSPLVAAASAWVRGAAGVALARRRSPRRFAFVVSFASRPAARAFARLWARRLGRRVVARRSRLGFAWLVSLPVAVGPSAVPASWSLAARPPVAALGAVVAAAAAGRFVPLSA